VDFGDGFLDLGMGVDGMEVAEVDGWLGLRGSGRRGLMGLGLRGFRFVGVDRFEIACILSLVLEVGGGLQI
jgi:hypothetical protein